MKRFSLIAAMLLGATTLFGGVYNVDVAHSNVGFKIKHMMISTVTGKFDTFKGHFDYDEKTGTLKALEGEIEAASINTGIEKRDEHLRSKDLFEVESYPKITFKLTKAAGDKVHGTLSIKGISKDIVLEYENGGTAKDPWGNMRAGIALSGKIDRRDYNITWNKVLEAGGVAVGEEVKLIVEIEGILQK